MGSLNPVWFDYVIVFVILISSGIGIIRGFVSEALSLLTWIVSAYLSFIFYNDASSLLESIIATPSIRVFTSFSLIFLVILIVGSLVTQIIKKIISYTGISGTDHMLGLLFGCLRGILLVSVMIIVAELTPVVNDKWWQQSLLIHYFNDLVIVIKSVLPFELKQFLG